MRPIAAIIAGVAILSSVAAGDPFNRMPPWVAPFNHIEDLFVSTEPNATQHDKMICHSLCQTVRMIFNKNKLLFCVADEQCTYYSGELDMCKGDETEAGKMLREAGWRRFKKHFNNELWVPVPSGRYYLKTIGERISWFALRNFEVDPGTKERVKQIRTCDRLKGKGHNMLVKTPLLIQTLKPPAKK